MKKYAVIMRKNDSHAFSKILSTHETEIEANKFVSEIRFAPHNEDCTVYVSQRKRDGEWESIDDALERHENERLNTLHHLLAKSIISPNTGID